MAYEITATYEYPNSVKSTRTITDAVGATTIEIAQVQLQKYSVIVDGTLKSGKYKVVSDMTLSNG